ncbi:MAG: hypothetical protein AAGK05_13785 [Pseudomonadota bacterium]
MTTLTKKPGIYLIKSGTLDLNDLSKLLEVKGLKSDMAEVSVTNNNAPLTIGHFTMSPGEEFEYFYDSVEYKVVTKGRIIVRDGVGRGVLGLITLSRGSTLFVLRWTIASVHVW